MKGVMKRLNALGFTLELSEEAKDFIAEKGYDVQFGARPLHRAIQKYLEDPLEEILNMNIKPGDVMLADLSEDKTKILFTLKEPSKGNFRSLRPAISRIPRMRSASGPVGRHVDFKQYIIIK